MASEKKYSTLALTLHALEQKIYMHASLNQVETVESFLEVALRKAKLTNDLSLIANWTADDIKNKKVHIIVSAQNEIPNIKNVDVAFDSFQAIKFKHLQFIKFIEYSDHKNFDELSITVSSGGRDVHVRTKDLKFHVAKHGVDEYGRSIKLGIYIDEIIDTLIKPTKTEDHWIPDPNLFYMLDLIFGEYYMTKHISTINCFPKLIMTSDTEFLTALEAKESIDLLLKITHNYCNVCGISEYRTKLIKKDSYTCINCIKTKD